MERMPSAEAFHEWQRRLKGDLRPDSTMVTICGGTGCIACGSAGVKKAFQEELARRGLDDQIIVKSTGCHGFCEKGPIVVIQPSAIFYPSVQVEDVPEIVDKTLVRGEVIDRFLYVDPISNERAVRDHDVQFYSKQKRVVFRLNGLIDPVSLEDYVAHDGYSALVKALTEMQPQEVIDEVREAGLRGRGGAGFSTGAKWDFCRQAPGSPKYLICNADEGDPGAFMDRSLLEGTPHAIVEGMLIAAYAIGAAHGIIYVRAEYPLAVKNTGIALDQARSCGLLGDDILGTGFDFDIRIFQGAGAFVCGEETALIASLEGRRGMPRPRPPFPVVSGYLGNPTNINNVETFANVPVILLRGSDWYRGIGTETSKGTKIFALAGKVNNTGLVEVPMGVTLREIIYDIGGGIPRGRKFKAAQMGGPSGGCVPARYLDLPIDYDSVKEVGAIMGSGGLVVMDEATCMVDIARFFTEFVQSESCGKCVPCRIGTRRMLEILTRITEGKGELADIDRLVKLGEMIGQTSLCGLGQTASNPVLSTIRYFRDEYEAHIVEKRCPANACEALVTTTCSSACPAHVNVPEYVGLIAAGRFAEALDVIRRRNPLASVCGRACDHPCESFCRRGDVDEPVAIRHLKRSASDFGHDGSEPPKWYGPRSGKVAVIGSGPAGLTAAYFLALLGREIRVFEALDVVGGVLAAGIPSYRLPPDVLARDIDFIKRAGVQIETGHRIESLDELVQAGYDAIFVATGAQESVALGIPGEEMEGVHDALAFLRRVSAGELTGVSGQVAVIGGGNAAIDAARTALRLGADSVTVLYRRTLDEMPAIRDEIDDAIAEGVELRLLVAPVAVEGDGCVKGIRCVEMELGKADESGRRRPVPKPGSEVLIETDHVIVAIGQGPDLDFAVSHGQIIISDGRLKVAPVTQRSGEGIVFGGGDVVTGPATIIEAVAAGQRAAQAIDLLLGGSGDLPPDTGFAPRAKPDEKSAATPRHSISHIPPAERVVGFSEVIGGYCLEVACKEAQRCLRCDLEE